MGLRQMFAVIWDEMYAPPGALDGDSIVVMSVSAPVAPDTAPMHDMPTPEWHNNFGTAPDYSVPASFDSGMGSFDSFGSSDSSFGCSWD